LTKPSGDHIILVTLQYYNPFYYARKTDSWNT